MATSGPETCSHPALYTCSCSRPQRLRLQDGTFTVPRAGCCLLLRNEWEVSEIPSSEKFLPMTSLSLPTSLGGFDLLQLIEFKVRALILRTF